jgi:hypothetical protein
VFASQAKTRLSDDNVRARLVRPAVERANARRVAGGLPPLPTRVTPHTLRRTYISIDSNARPSVPESEALAARNAGRDRKSPANGAF